MNKQIDVLINKQINKYTWNNCIYQRAETGFSRVLFI